MRSRTSARRVSLPSGTIRRVLLASVLLGPAVFPVAVRAQTGAPAPGRPAPLLSWRTLEDKKGDITKFRGKIVIVVFFKPGDAASNEALDAIRRALSSFGPRGVEAVGIAMTENADAVRNTIRDQKIDYPVHFDEKNFAVNVAKGWGVKTAPKLFILDPDRRIAQEGVAPAQLPAALQNQIERTPPRTVDEALLKAALQNLKFAEDMVQAGKPKTAARSLSLITEDVQASEQIAKRYVAAGQKVAESWPKFKEEVETLFNANKPADAVVMLEQLKVVFKGAPEADQVDTELNSFLDDPDLKAQVEKGRPAALADDLLNSALDFAEYQQLNNAYLLCRQLLAEYPKSAAAEKAKGYIEDWESDPARRRQLRDAYYGRQATAMLMTGDSYRTSRMNDKARSFYEQILKDYPGTTAAEKAEAALKTLK